MFYLRYLSLAAITLVLFIACEQKEQIVEKKGINEKLGFNRTEYLVELKNKLLTNNSPAFRNDSLEYFDTLKYYYSSHNFEPIFINSFEEGEFIDSILSFFVKADEHGLDTGQYHISNIRLEFLKSIDTLKNALRYSHLANAELLLTNAIVKYSFQLRYGVLNPKMVFADDYFLPYNDSLKGGLFEPLNQKNIVQYLNDIQPKSKRYRELQIALKNFKKYEDIEFEPISLSVNKLEVGTKNPSIDAVIKRLIDLNYLDTAIVKINEYDIYDSTLVDYVKKFQRLNGLNDDGVIGKSTVDKLNTPSEEYINKIKINLERFRWNNYKDTSFVLVNIPDFRLFIIEDGKKSFNIKVCTGIKRSKYFYDQRKKYKKTKRLYDKPEDWETPILYSEIAYMVLNPTWNVPSSIMRQEIAQNLKKDPNYLSTHNFKVYLNNESINPDTVQVKDLLSEKNPYRIVQDAGAGNALGKIKFMFNNPFGVYLHDTPTRPPFNSSYRAVSHGCVRVEKPMVLAEFLLRNQTKWNIDFLKLEIGQKVDNKEVVSEFYKKRSELRKNTSLGKTTDIKLIKKVPLYIDYFTAWVDENGEVNFRDDVYGKDKIILENLLAKSQ